MPIARREMLVSKGGLLYAASLPDRVVLSAPAAGSQFEIVDAPFVTGEEYDQWKFVCRKTAEALVARYPDMWEIKAAD